MAEIKDVAKYFLSKADPEVGDTISNLKLQKLTYYAQAWHLAIHDQRLFDAEFQAWAHGPVNLGLYHDYRDYGSGPIPYPEDFDEAVLTVEEIVFLDDIWSAYGKFSALYLRNLTHQEEPWLHTRGDLPEGAACSEAMDEGLMRDFYRGFIEDGQED